MSESTSKKVLVIGNHIVVSLCMELCPKYLVIPYQKAAKARGCGMVDWGLEAIKTFMSAKPDYDAIIVDLTEAPAVDAIRSTGYDKPVIGLVSSKFDKMPGTDALALIFEKKSVQRTLDKLLS